MQFGFSKTLSLTAIASATALLAACGGGGGTGSSPSSAPVQGKAVDFYLSGATVSFLDCSNQTTTTNATGDFTFPANCTQSALTVKGGTDIGTGLPFNGVLQAPAVESKPGVTPVISPLTTLVAQLGTAQAAALATKLGLDGKDLLTLDPLKDGTALKAAVVVQQLVEQISKTLVGVATSAGGTLNANIAAAAAANAVANAISSASSSANLTEASTVTKAIEASVQNVKSSLPSSLQNNIGAVAVNVAVLATPTVSKLATDISTALGTITPGADATTTVAALQNSGALNSVRDSATSSIATTLVSAVAPTALANSSLTSTLASLGTAVATGTPTEVTTAVNNLGSAVVSSTLVNAVTLADYIQLGNVTLNGGTPTPLSPSLSVNGGSLSDIQVALSRQGAPFGTGASEVRAGMRYTYNGNTVEVIIDKVALAFSGSTLTAATVPANVTYSFRISGAVTASAALSNGMIDNLFSSTGGGSLDLPFAVFLNKLKSAGGLSDAQINALIPKATSTVNVAFAVIGTSGNKVKLGIPSGTDVKETAVVSVATAASQVSGDGVTTEVTVNP